MLSVVFFLIRSLLILKTYVLKKKMSSRVQDLAIQIKAITQAPLKTNNLSLMFDESSDMYIHKEPLEILIRIITNKLLDPGLKNQLCKLHF